MMEEGSGFKCFVGAKFMEHIIKRQWRSTEYIQMYPGTLKICEKHGTIVSTTPDLPSFLVSCVSVPLFQGLTSTELRTSAIHRNLKKDLGIGAWYSPVPTVASWYPLLVVAVISGLAPEPQGLRNATFNIGPKMPKWDWIQASSQVSGVHPKTGARESCRFTHQNRWIGAIRV